MLPPDAFHDLVDLGATFDVVQPISPGPANVYRVSPAQGGLLNLRAGVEGDDLDAMWTGPAKGVLGTINALLLREWGLGRQGVRLPATLFLDEGKVCSFEIRPTGAEAVRRRLKPFKAESEILYADAPDQSPRQAVVSTSCLGKSTLHLLQTAEAPGLFPVERLSPNALPLELHKKLAARGHFEASYVALHGRPALLDARISLSEMKKAQQKRMAASDGGPSAAREATPARKGSAGKAGAAVTPADGLFPYAFAHKVQTSWGETFVRSEGKVRIPSAQRGATPAFEGDFLVPKQSTIPRLALTTLEIHAVEGRLYSRLAPMLGSRLPDQFGRGEELSDVLLWRKQPRAGIDGHPFVQALREFDAKAPRGLADHICPPDWDVVFHGRDRSPHFVYAALYDGLQSLSGQRGFDYHGYLTRHQAAGPPAIVEEGYLDAKRSENMRSGADALRAAMSKTLEGRLALVGGSVMIGTAEPCWKLSLAKGGDLRLDLQLSQHLEGRDGLAPTLFFALDEMDACNAAIEELLASAPKQNVRTRGELRGFEPSACRINGYASSIAYLGAGLRESLHHAAKVLPAEASSAATALRDILPHDRPPSIMPFAHRTGIPAKIPDGVPEAWDRLMDLAGEEVSLDSDSPWISRLAGHGMVLRHIATALGHEMKDRSGPAWRMG